MARITLDSSSSVLILIFLATAALFTGVSIAFAPRATRCPSCPAHACGFPGKEPATSPPETHANTTPRSGAYVPKGDRPLVIPDDVCIYIVLPFSRGNWTETYDKSFHDFSEDMMAGLRPAIKAGASFVVHSIDGHEVNLSERFLKMIGGVDETVPEKVAKRLKSPGATKDTCKWIVQARVDADDYLGEQFVSTLLNLLRHEIAARATFKAAIIHQRRLTRVYVFPLPDNSFSCILYKHPTSGVGPQVSTGFTLVVRRDLWEAEGSPSVLDGSFSVVYQRTSHKYGEHFSNLFYPPDGVTMSPVTQLSSHYPWFDPGPHPPCNFEEIEDYFGSAAAVHLSVARIPRISILDTCLSNNFVIGILRRNTGLSNLTCEGFQKLWTENQHKKNPLKTVWPGRR